MYTHTHTYTYISISIIIIISSSSSILITTPVTSRWRRCCHSCDLAVKMLLLLLQLLPPTLACQSCMLCINESLFTPHLAKGVHIGRNAELQIWMRCFRCETGISSKRNGLVSCVPSGGSGSLTICFVFSETGSPENQIRVIQIFGFG